MPEVEELDPKTEAVFKRKGYKIEKALSKGAFGQVYKAREIKSGDAVAVKVMNLEKVDKNFKNKFLPREMAAMISADHKYLIKVYDIFKSNKRIYIFMEFAGNGDISGYIKKHGPIDAKLTCYWFKQTAEGLDYFHNTLYMAHRDIKVDNILLNDENEAKLSDFGFAKKSYDEDKEEVVMSETYCGTAPYYCPQLVRRVPYDPYKADVWAMGVVLFAMLNDKFVYHWDPPKKMYKEMTDPDYLEGRYVKEFCKHLKDLMRHLLAVKESDRYDVKDILSHKWIKAKAKCCQP